MMRCFSEKRKEIVMSEKNYVQELVDIIRSGLPENELVERISDLVDIILWIIFIFILLFLLF